MTHHAKRIAKVLGIGVAVAVLSYLFHPGVGHFSLSIDGEPVADPLIRFTAIPTLLLILALTVLLAVLLVLGAGLFVFFGSLFLVLLGTVIIAPYFWPMLLVISLFVALGVDQHGNFSRYQRRKVSS